jgi:exosortase D (VPLPA-CTERM-specific)
MPFVCRQHEGKLLSDHTLQGKMTRGSWSTNKNFLKGLAFGVLLGAFCLQYYAIFGNIVTSWDQDFEFCYLVPFIFLYLIHANRESIKAHQPRSSNMGFLVLLCSGVICLSGQLGSITTLTYVSIWLAIVGLSLLLLGITITKVLAFPFLVLAFIVPLPPFLNRLLTFKLKLISSGLSVKMMQAIGLSAYREGNIIDLGLTQLQVVDACSGLRYVYPLLLMGLLFGYFFHKKWWERLIVLFAAIPISVFSNALRIAITGYLTTKVSQQAADKFFHGFSGWLIFMTSLLVLACLSGLLKIVQPKSKTKTQENAEQRGLRPGPFDLGGMKTSYLWMASAIFVAFWALNTAFASAQYSPKRQAFEQFPVVIGDWKGTRMYIREEILDELWADDYIQMTFTHAKTGETLLVFVPYYEYQKTRHTAHSPVSCLVGGGFAPKSDSTIAREWPAPFRNVEIRQMVMERSGRLVLSNYWFQQRGRVISSEYWNKWYLFWDSITKRRTDGALVRIEMPLREGQAVEEAQAEIDSFTRELLVVLPDYVPS